MVSDVSHLLSVTYSKYERKCWMFSTFAADRGGYGSLEDPWAFGRHCYLWEVAVARNSGLSQN